MSDSLPEAPTKSGAVLKAAREEMSLSLDQVADELHLRPSVVKAIEEENYDEFSSDVFLKGYFRTYCRLVNLHETRMMELLEQQLLSRKKEVELKEQQANKIVQGKKRKKLFITLVVFILCLSLIGIAYKLASQTETTSNTTNASSHEASSEPQDKKTISDESLGEASAANTKPLNSEARNTEDVDSENNRVKPEVDVTSQIEDSPETEGSVDADKTKISSQEPSLQNSNSNADDLTVVPIQSAVSSENQALIDADDESLIENENQAEQTQIMSQLHAEFSGDCWFKVVDGTGKTVIAALKKAGSVAQFTGLAPFHLVVGDANTVSIEFNGKEVNLSPYTSRNGRAELTLRQTETESEG